MKKDLAFSVPTASRTHILRPVIKTIVGDLTNKRLLDVGCGNGYWTRFFSKAGASCTGIDIKTSQIESAKKEHDGNRYLVADAQTFRSKESFDVIYLDHVLSEQKSKAAMLKILKNLRKILVDDGIFILSEMHPAVAHFPIAVTTERNYFYFKSPSKFVFDVKRSDDTYAQVTDYHWTLTDYAELFVKSGFVIENMVEPRLSKRTKDAYLRVRAQKLRRSWGS